MRTLTLFSPKGGTGRTMATMLLAIAALLQGRRVLLLDASDDAAYAHHGKPALLEEGAARVRTREPLLPLAAVAARDADALCAALGTAKAVGAQLVRNQRAARAAIRAARAASFSAALGGVAPDLVLVDTAARPDDRARLALREADLVLIPFQSCVEAGLLQAPLHHELTSAWPRHLPFPPVLAVGCALGADRTGMALNGALQGCQGDEAWRDKWEFAWQGAEMRANALAAMREGWLVRTGRVRLLETEFPRASDLLRLLWRGEFPLAGLRRGGVTSGDAGPKAAHGAAIHPALLADLAAVCLVAAEIELAAQGLDAAA